MEKNYIRLDDIIGEKNLQEIDKAIRMCVEKVEKTFAEKHLREPTSEERAELIKEARKYILAQMLEMFGTWKKTGDCLPTGIQMGKLSKFFVEIKEEK